MAKNRIVLKDRLDRTEQVVPLSDRRERVDISLGGSGNRYKPVTPPPTVPFGRVEVFGHLEMNDDEKIGGGSVLGYDLPAIDTADEHLKLDNLSAWADVDTSFERRFYWEGRCGGEIRFEVDMIAGINEADPNLLEFQTSARLYEGTSTDTTDLDGWAEQYIQIPRGTTSTVFGLVRNTEESENDDWGIFSFRVKFS
jgi:hypothetical protein